MHTCTQVLEVAHKELLQECDYVHEAEATTRFKRLLAPYPEVCVYACMRMCMREVYACMRMCMREGQREGQHPRS